MPAGRPKGKVPPDNERCIHVGKNGRCKNRRQIKKDHCKLHGDKKPKFHVGKKPRFFIGWDATIAYIEDRIVELHEDQVTDAKGEPFSYSAKTSMIDRHLKNLIRAMENRDRREGSSERVILIRDDTNPKPTKPRKTGDSA